MVGVERGNRLPLLVRFVDDAEDQFVVAAPGRQLGQVVEVRELVEPRPSGQRQLGQFGSAPDRVRDPCDVAASLLGCVSRTADSGGSQVRPSPMTSSSIFTSGSRPPASVQPPT